MQTSPINEALYPIFWIIGKWRSISAKGIYPTITPFTYCEEMEFKSLGQPLLNYKSNTWNPATQLPMHLETGFLRIKPQTNTVAFMVAHNLGITSVEEGFVQGNCLSLKTDKIESMKFVKHPYVTHITRTYRYCSESQQLCSIICMATYNTPLHEHIRVIYERIRCCPNE